MKKTAFLSLLFWLAALSFAPAARGELVAGPYLQSLAPDAVSVCAFAREGDAVAVRWTPTGGEPRLVAARGRAPACASLAGLLPDIAYEYELLINGSPVAEGPPPSFVADSETDVSFVIFGDTRSGDDSFDLAHRQVVRAIRETTVPDAIIHTGDFVERGDRHDLWVNYFRIESDLLSSAPVFPAVGRSDQPPALMRAYFPVLAEKPWYSFDRAGAHVAVLNLWQASSQEAGETTAGGPQARWLREDLAKARASGKTYLFVVMHEPAINIEGWSTSAAAQVFMPIFEAFGVTAVFSGAHYFSHALRNGVHYFTNGGGGALLDARTPKEGVFNFFNRIHHFLVLDVGRVGASVKAVDSHGGVFFSLDLGEAAPSEGGASSPAVVRTFSGGTRLVPLTVFTNPGCDDCDSFEDELPGIAKRTDTTLVATFRSLEEAENRAALAALTDGAGPVPIVVVGSEVFSGPGEIRPALEEAVLRAEGMGGADGLGTGRLLLIAAVSLAGLILLFLFLSVKRKSGRQRRV